MLLHPSNVPAALNYVFVCSAPYNGIHNLFMVMLNQWYFNKDLHRTNKRTTCLCIRLLRLALLSLNIDFLRQYTVQWGGSALANVLNY